MRTIKNIDLVKKNTCKKNIFFTVSAGTNGSNSLNAMNILTLEAKGNKLLEELVDEVEETGYDYAIIALHRLATKNPQRKPFLKFKLVFNEEVKAPVLGGFEAFGGLDGFVQKEVRTATLIAENERIKNILSELKLEKKEADIELKQLSSENKELLRKVEKSEWEISVLKRNHQFEIENNEKKQSALDKILTIGGAAFGSVLDIDADKMKGLLGLNDVGTTELPLEENKPSQTQDNQEDVSTEINYEEDLGEYDNEPAKKGAKQIADEIYKFTTTQIRELPAHDALALMNALGAIMKYIAIGKSNLYELLNIINGKKVENENESHN